MYFPEKITKIKKTDRVLEIGPGTSPHVRSNVLLEKKFNDENEHFKQCGGKPIALTDPRTVYYDGGSFPFCDGEFDYVICSHVIEHVDDVSKFIAEMFRVCRAGYLEYPLIYYDYVFDIPEHLNVCMWRADTLVYAKKSEIFLGELKPAQQLWYKALAAGYTDTVTELAPYLMQGFEWNSPFEIHKANDIGELFLNDYVIPVKQAKSTLRHRLFKRVSYILKKFCFH